MELDLTAVKTAFAQFSGEAADETGTQREALCAALCGQCARQVASLARGDLSQAAQALWEAPLEELAAALGALEGDSPLQCEMLRGEANEVNLMRAASGT